MQRILTILLTALGFAGFASCDIREEYGSPHADFELKGVVTDADQDPIKGIRVSVGWLNGHYPDSPIITDREGRYEIKTQVGFIPDSFIVEFDDTDGEANGGEFKSAASAVVINDSDYNGGGGNWYAGKVIKTADIVLELKTEE